MAGGMQAPTGGSYTNSGLGRFGNVPMYQPTPYTPTLFAAPQLAPARPMVNRGLLAPAPDYVDRTSGGSSGTVGDPSTNAVSDTATVGTPGDVASIAVAGLTGGFPGAVSQAISIANQSQAISNEMDALGLPGSSGSNSGSVSSGPSGIGIGSVGAGATGEGDGGAGEGGGGGAGGGGK